MVIIPIIIVMKAAVILAHCSRWVTNVIADPAVIIIVVAMFLKFSINLFHTFQSHTPP